MLWDQTHTRNRSRMTILIAISGLALFFTILLLTSTPLELQLPHLGQFSSQDDGKIVGESRFLLHPQDHSFRQPKTIELQWRVTSCERRPDGVLKTVCCINEQFPGPTIEARSGDRLVIEVENALEDDEGVSIHWHGLWMKGANEMDGAVGITQNPILSGAKFTYDFTIDDSQSGTFWYHAHSGVKRADGLYGGLIVHAPASRGDNSEDTVEWLAMVSDWYHRPAIDALYFYSHPGAFGNEPVPDSVLLNGAGSYNCEDAVPARPLDCEFRGLAGSSGLSLDQGKRNIVRLINVGSYAGFTVKTSNAALKPVRVDGGHAVDEGRSAHSVGVIFPGQRADLLVVRSSSSTDEVIEVTLDDTPFKYPNAALTLTHQFPIVWSGSQRVSNWEPPKILDFQSLKASSLTRGPASEAQEILVLYVKTQKMASRDNVPLGFINGTSWKPLVTPPQPLLAVDREKWDKNQFVPHIDFLPESPLWVDLIVNNLDEEGHEFHLHGYDVWVLSTYSSTYNWGSYNPFEDAEPPGGPYDLERPLKRDTVYVPRRGYAVLRVLFDVPGIWMFHCHTLWHQSSGMAMALEVG